MAKAKKKEALLPVEEQPYQIPENWYWTRIENISEIVSKGTTPKGGKDAYIEEGVKFLRVENFLDDGMISHEGIAHVAYDVHESFLKRSILQENDVLVSIAGTLGKTAIIQKEDLPINTNQAVAFIRINPKMKVLPTYLRYLLANPAIQNYLLGKTKVTSIPNLTLEIISSCPVPVPPLAEQQRIVEQIESLFAKLDEAKDRVQDALHSYRNRKTMIIHNAFAGNYTRVWREKNGYSINDWKCLTLNDVAEYKKGPFGSSITKAMFVPKASNTYKVYEQGNAIRKTMDYGSYYITEEKYRELKGFAIQEGDIIISCAGTIGEVYKLPKGCEAGVINQALMRVRTFDNIDEKFFIYYFGEVLKGDVNEQANGTAIKNIPPFKIMKAMEIKLPTLAEQQEIVALLDKVLYSEKQSEDMLNMMIEQIEQMKKSILAKAFRGELGTNNPDEESAVEFLKFMLATE